MFFQLMLYISLFIFICYVIWKLTGRQTIDKFTDEGGINDPVPALKKLIREKEMRQFKLGVRKRELATAEEEVRIIDQEVEVTRELAAVERELLQLKDKLSCIVKVRNEKKEKS